MGLISTSQTKTVTAKLPQTRHENLQEKKIHKL